MGSGLILLVIVAAWLAVLVPMALRSHDSADSLSSVDRFSDAMRVLSRRDAAARARARAVAGRSRLGSDLDDGDLDDDDLDDGDLDDGDLDDLGDWQAWEERESLLQRLRHATAGAARSGVALVRRDRRPLTPVRRRRRLLGALVLLALGTLAAGLLLDPVLLSGHAVADLLLLLFVVQLRRLARRRSVRTGARATRPQPERRAVRVRPGQLPAEDPDGAPPEQDEAVEADALPPAAPEPAQEPAVAVAAPAASTAARHDEPLPAAGLGAPWSPVPVPPPMYAQAPVASRSTRTVDLTRPGAYSEAVAAGERLPGMDDDAADAEQGVAGAAERRRAVNGW